jgi:helix-hairpin-helix protein
VTVVGHAAIISAGEWVIASGEWINDRAHGQQFKARFLKTSAPSSIDGIEKYVGSGMIRGIGPFYAKKMVKAFGEKVFDVIEAEPDRLREVTGIGGLDVKKWDEKYGRQPLWLLDVSYDFRPRRRRFYPPRGARLLLHYAQRRCQNLLGGGSPHFAVASVGHLPQNSPAFREEIAVPNILTLDQI